MKLVLLFFLVLISVEVQAFLPKIKSYGSKDFNTNPTCYDIARDAKSGKMYFATAYQLIEFDGINYKQLSVPSTIFVCQFDNNGKMYVGGENEIGYFENTKNELVYRSISNHTFKPFGRVLHIEIKDDDIAFYSSKNIIYYNIKSKQTKTIVKSTFQTKLFVPIKLQNTLSNIDLSSVFKLQDGGYAVGTKSEGVLIFDNNNKLKYHLLIKDGLVSNAINKLYQDHCGDLWVASNKGVSVIKLGSPFTYLEVNQGLDGMGNCVLQNGEEVYLGTSNGLYKTYLPLNHIDKIFAIPNINSKVHSVNKFGPTIFCCTEMGLFIKNKGQKFEKIKGYNGIVWTIIALDSLNNKYLVGTIDGIYYLNKSSTSDFVLGNKLSGFSISSRNMLLINQQLWVLHAVQGLYLLTLIRVC